MTASNELSTGPRPRLAGIAQACTICYQRKIKCDLSTGKTTCTNCSLYNTDCLPRLRKRKRTTISSASFDDSPGKRTRAAAAGVAAPLSPASLSVTRRSQAYGNPAQDVASPTATVAAATRSSPVCSPGMGRSASVEEQGEDEQGTEGPKATPTGMPHDGKAVYFGTNEGRLVEATNAYPPTTTMSPAELTSLQQCGAFEYPSRARKACFIDNFFKYCYPWAPIVERSWLQETPTQKPSALMVQAVLLAGSRVTTPNNIEASRAIYQRAKSLFFSNYEQNPVRRVISCLLLRWWCLTGQDRVCIDNSHFWIGTGMRIAISIGLNVESSGSARDASYRRRLWWSLVAHDCQLSAVHGWPASIHEEDHNVSLPDARDFFRNGPSSLAFITISRIFGDIGHSYRRKQRTVTGIEKLQNALYMWINELPDELRLFHSKPTLGPNAYNFEARQLHVMFFVDVILLFRQPTSPGPDSLSVETILAASFVAGLYEEFLIRDEMSHIGLAVHKFFLLTAGVTCLLAQRIPPLTAAASEDFNIIIKALDHYSTRYPSAKGTIRTLENLKASQSQASGHSVTLVPSQANANALFRGFGADLCRQWHIMDLTSPVSHCQEVAQTPQLRVSDSHEMAWGASLGHVPGDHGATDQLFSVGNPYDPPMTNVDSALPYHWPDQPDPTDWILECMPFDIDGTTTLP